jgi:uncharacterized protein YdeI (YjbR/CyaY-like superfamily)
MKNHDMEKELWVGYYKKATKIPSINWSQSVDEGLCFGWIDGLRKSIDEKSYKIRFTPRKAKSHWSTVNINKMEELLKLGLVTEKGKATYANREEKNSSNASHEQKTVQLDDQYLVLLKKNKKAFKFYQSLSPYVKKASNWYIMSAKREETREKRLQLLISSSEKNLKIPQLRKGGK